MMVHIHSFDWFSYSKIVMPAFAHWLIQENSQEIQKLYFATRSAQEDQQVPEAMRSLCAWPRALDFVKLLPRGPFARREYQKLCTAEQFLLLSDHYVYRNPPQLFRESQALRTIWGACVEHYCLPWYQQLQQALTPPTSFTSASSTNEMTMARKELFDLLETAGLSELARELTEPSPAPLQTTEEVANEQTADQEEDEDEEGDAPKGIFIGRLPTTLHLRGWLATQSVHAMVLFEYLACGRRTLPFGSQEGDPFGSYVGYLTPDEVQNLHACLRHAQPPSAGEAALDYTHFRQQRDKKSSASARLIDEILPTHAQEFFSAVHNAATQRLGLICTIG